MAKSSALNKAERYCPASCVATKNTYGNDSILADSTSASTAYLTDVTCESYLLLQYLPIGELMLEEYRNSNRVPYLHNGKVDIPD